MQVKQLVLVKQVRRVKVKVEKLQVKPVEKLQVNREKLEKPVEKVVKLEVRKVKVERRARKAEAVSEEFLSSLILVPADEFRARLLRARWL